MNSVKIPSGKNWSDENVFDVEIGNSLKTAEDVITYKNLNDNNIESVYWAKAIIISDSINCIKTTNCKIARLRF